uniref:Autochaperone domain-containing protein n=1 Tax=Panagrolaimus superbus TaxID=310955 RepID=A0A914XTF9_9BILA
MESQTGGQTLTVTGDYAGTGGTVVINTVLGDDNSKTDRLKIGGDSSGTTNLKVNAISKPGAQTVNGIQVVEVAGQSDGTFSLVSDYTTKDGQKAVVGGAYAYTLHQGSGSGNKDGNWYLTSQLTQEPQKPDTDPDCKQTNTCPTDPDKTRYSAGVPVYQGYVQNMQVLNKLPTLQERVGDRYLDWANDNAADQANGAAVDSRGIWARIEGAHNRLEPRSATGMKQDINSFIMQTGVDGQAIWYSAWQFQIVLR